MSNIHREIYTEQTKKRLEKCNEGKYFISLKAQYV